jgi:gamma-glutamyltranspeptidase/glutathione hydrolase/leukotriene-C4 hydrolase
MQEEVENSSTKSSGYLVEGRNRADGNKYQPLEIEGDINPMNQSSVSSYSEDIVPSRTGQQLLSSRFAVESAKRKYRQIIVLVAVPLLFIIVILSIGIANKNSSSSSSSSGSNGSSSLTDEQLLEQHRITSTKGAVATDNQICSQIGVNILDQGGNAVDAAIAAKLCLGVVSPASSGIGGGGYILIYSSSGSTQEFIDCRETAPGAATPRMFVNDPIAAQDGGLAIAVPGEIQGLYLAYQRHGSGKISWKNLILPAALLAEEWRISPELYAYILIIKKQLFSGKYQPLADLYLKNHGKSVKEIGDIVNQPTLSKTLMMIGEYGPDYLYKTMSTTLAKEIQNAGGIITKEDIESYEPLITPPLIANISGYHYIGVGGSSSGGPSIIGILRFMSSLEQPLVSQGSAYYHYLIECFKHIFAIRTNLGDPFYVNTTNVYNAILSEEYMNDLEKHHTNDLHIQKSLYDYGGKYNLQFSAKDDAGTTHLSVIDSDGNAVSFTSTVNTYFGSKVISPSTGILFNNQMDDFSIPGSPNFFGLPPSPFNYPEPYKRPLSSMSPSIVLDQYHRVRLIGGASGGPRIITSTAQARLVLNFTFFLYFFFVLLIYL